MFSLVETQVIVDYRDETGCALSVDQSMRQSFDRFDDNLVENILSYLTFNEKVLFESVSKRFQKLVFNQQKELSLTKSGSEDSDVVDKIQEDIDVIDYRSATAVAFGYKRINKFWLKSLLKKCKSIEKVYLDCFLDLEDLDIICRNCPKLKTIEFDPLGLNADDLDHFGNRYGEMFEKVEILYQTVEVEYWKRFFIHCKNLRQVCAQNTSKLLMNDNKNYLPNLEIIKDYQVYLQDDDYEKTLKDFDMFCEKYSETLIKFNCISQNCFMKAKDLVMLFKSISKLSKLQELNFYRNYDYTEEFDEDFYIEHIIEISRCNTQLKKLQISISTSPHCKIQSNIFDTFKGFNNLIELSIYIYGKIENIEIIGSVECLRYTNLKSLDVSIDTINEEFFRDVDIYLPNLTDLMVVCESEFTDKTIKQLANLKHLKDFRFHTHNKCNKYITDESICAIINNCPALEFLSFRTRPNITGKTIEALIHCANSYPKKSLEFRSGLSEEENLDQLIPAIDLISFVNRIPENLTIDYEFVNNDNEE